MGRLHGCSERRRSWVARYAKEKTTSATTTSLRTSRAARVQGRALQRGRHTRAATRTARLAKTEDEAMMVNAGVARMRRDGRRWTMLGISLRKTRSEGRDVKTTGGALARRGVLVSAGGYARPPTMQTTTGGAESSLVMDMLAGLSVVAGAWRRRRPAPSRQWGHRRVLGSQPSTPRWHDAKGRGIGRSSRVPSVSGGYSDRSGRCRDAMGCSGQRDGALRLSEVGSQHGRGDRSATADGIGQYEGIGNPTAQPQQMASATVWASKRASVCTRIAAVDAEMARCDSAEDR